MSNSCDLRMLRYMAGVTWKDRLYSERVVKRYGSKSYEAKSEL